MISRSRHQVTKTVGVVSDVKNLKSISDAYVKSSGTLGKIDVPIVNAAVAEASPLADVTEESFDRTSNTNFKGVLCRKIITGPSAGRPPIWMSHAGPIQKTGSEFLSRS